MDLPAPFSPSNLSTRQKPDVFTDRHRDAGHDDFVVNLLVERQLQASGEREQRLACARLPEQCDEIDVRIHEQIEREILLAITRCDAPDCVLVMAEITQRL